MAITRYEDAQASSLSAKNQMAFQERMSNTAHQREVADLKAAGLNPILSAGGSGATTPVGAEGDFTVDQISSLVSSSVATVANAFGNSAAKIIEATKDDDVNTKMPRNIYQAAMQGGDEVWKGLTGQSIFESLREGGYRLSDLISGKAELAVGINNKTGKPGLLLNYNDDASGKRAAENSPSFNKDKAFRNVQSLSSWLKDIFYPDRQGFVAANYSDWYYKGDVAAQRRHAWQNSKYYSGSGSPSAKYYSLYFKK